MWLAMIVAVVIVGLVIDNSKALVKRKCGAWPGADLVFGDNYANPGAASERLEPQSTPFLAV
jgi:hypothetical protein